VEAAIIVLIGVAVTAYLVTVIHAATVQALGEREKGERPETLLITWPRWLFGVIALLLAAWLLYRVRGILTPFLLGGVIAYLLDPIIDRMTDRGVPRHRAIGLVFLLLLVVLVFAGTLIVPAVVDEARTLMSHYGEYAQRGRALVASVERVASYWGSRLGVVPADTQRAAAELIQGAERWGLGLLHSALRGVNRTFSLLLLLVVTPVVGFWLLRDYHVFGRLLLRFLPEAHRQSTVEITRDINRIVAGYLLGIVTMCALIGTYSSLVLTILGARFSILLGVMTGVLSIIPYFGFPTAMVIIALSMAATGKGAGIIVVVLGLHILGNILSDYLVYPRVVGGRVGLHPLAVIFALLAGGALLNVVGVILAVPTAGVIKMLLYRFWPESFNPEEAPAAVRP